MGGAFMEKSTTIYWSGPETPPEEASYVLVRYLDDEGALICSPAAYEKGRFEEIGGAYIFQTGEVLGWSYLPYDERNPEQEA